MHIPMYVCVCVNLNTYIYVYKMHIHMYVCVCIYVNVRAYLCECLHTVLLTSLGKVSLSPLCAVLWGDDGVPVCIFVYACVCVCMCAYAFVCEFQCVCMCVRQRLPLMCLSVSLSRVGLNAVSVLQVLVFLCILRFRIFKFVFSTLWSRSCFQLTMSFLLGGREGSLL
jgi:hypothetical protein